MEARGRAMGGVGSTREVQAEGDRDQKAMKVRGVRPGLRAFWRLSTHPPGSSPNSNN